jgi:pyruvate kinase
MDTLSHLLVELGELEDRLLLAEKDRHPLMKLLADNNHAACRNMLHYLALRKEDIRKLQDQLHIFGLSSLASSESHIHSQLQAIQQRLGRIYPAEALDTCTYAFSEISRMTKAKELFGEKTNKDIPWIMITFDSSFAEDYDQVKELLLHGMNIARINCAHDGENSWIKMIEMVKKASNETGIACKIYMDLAGPKIRTVLPGNGSKKPKIELELGKVIYLVEEFPRVDIPKNMIKCSLPGVVRQLKNGVRVLFDDGKIETIVIDAEKEFAKLQIARISSKKPFLKSDKGINLPDTDLELLPLTDFDKECLPFICKHADMIGYSFVRHSGDVLELQTTMEKLNTKTPFIILKIETPESVEQLPFLLLQCMRSDLFGVMIARGDLAVEIGFERMSEIQEEISWICESAHVPVIFATQILENLNKTGMATRSEMTDAVYASMAECVMINKGEFTLEVLESLKNIMKRSGGHHVKKRYTFRPLHIAMKFMSESIPVSGPREVGTA